MTLKPHMLYRLAYNMNEMALRGKVIVFYEERIFTHGDVPRCRVRFLNQDGSTNPETELLIQKYCIINL